MPSKVITLILGALVWLLTFYPGGPLYLFAFSTAWLGAPSVLVFLGMWWKGTTKTGAFYGAILGMFVTALFTILERSEERRVGKECRFGESPHGRHKVLRDL